MACGPMCAPVILSRPNSQYLFWYHRQTRLGWWRPSGRARSQGKGWTAIWNFVFKPLLKLYFQRLIKKVGWQGRYEQEIKRIERMNRFADLVLSAVSRGSSCSIRSPRWTAPRSGPRAPPPARSWSGALPVMAISTPPSFPLEPSMRWRPRAASTHSCPTRTTSEPRCRRVSSV